MNELMKLMKYINSDLSSKMQNRLVYKIKCITEVVNVLDSLNCVGLSISIQK